MSESEGFSPLAEHQDKQQKLTLLSIICILKGLVLYYWGLYVYNPENGGSSTLIPLT